MEETLASYDDVLGKCKELFLNKAKDYGASWRILRTSSVTDQLYIKASRIRSLEENTVRKVEEGVESEYIGLVNYSIMALIQLELGSSEKPDLDQAALEQLYDKYVSSTRDLMIAKNHDYGEAWRQMRLSSITDLILVKLLRIRQIEDNDGKTIVSEGLDANYQDIINYALFALIKLKER
ncbi:DUF1599 domain-containing protein [Portibacter marinus]|uniref:DUF1599 domain-containing protein n=1 Tax=Portibacter marinus TaxID=2898660 RepID=UPI001F2EE6D4|nr:DUF1599 domain-containing protein [Portibacter marinus]